MNMSLARLDRANPVLPNQQAGTGLPSHDARALTAGGPLAQISLDGQLYTLRITRQGKLILTK